MAKIKGWKKVSSGYLQEHWHHNPVRGSDRHSNIMVNKIRNEWVFDVDGYVHLKTNDRSKAVKEAIVFMRSHP